MKSYCFSTVQQKEGRHNKRPCSYLCFHPLTYWEFFEFFISIKYQYTQYSSGTSCYELFSYIAVKNRTVRFIIINVNVSFLREGKRNNR